MINIFLLFLLFFSNNLTSNGFTPLHNLILNNFNAYDLRKEIYLNLNSNAKYLTYEKAKKIFHEEINMIDLYGDNELNIRGKAYDILRYLVQNKHRPPISKDELICALWDDPEMVCQNVIEVNINQIRAKLKKNLNLDLIDTVRNRGYKLKNI